MQANFKRHYAFNIRLIGDRVENRFKFFFNGFELMGNGSEGIVPDFFHEALKFWVEVKGSYNQADYGANIKEYQVEVFSNTKNPVVYFFGFHDFDNASTKLAGLTLPLQKLSFERALHLVSGYFISSELVKRIFVKEKKIVKKMIFYIVFYVEDF